MPQPAAKFVSAIVASLIAGAVQTSVSGAAPAPAADSCLSAPGNSAPQGSHWYYRVERPTKRHCWYLGKEGAKISQPKPADLAPSEGAAAQAPGTVMQSSVANAHAELNPQDLGRSPWPKRRAIADTRSSRPPQRTPSSITGTIARPSVVASRWPEAADVLASSSAPRNAGGPDASSTSPAPPIADVATLAAAAATTETPVYSLPFGLIPCRLGWPRWPRWRWWVSPASASWRFGLSQQRRQARLRDTGAAIRPSPDRDSFALSVDPGADSLASAPFCPWPRPGPRHNDRAAAFFARIATPIPGLRRAAIFPIVAAARRRIRTGRSAARA